MKYLQRIASLFGETVQQFLQDRAARQAAALSYYTVFAIGPLLLLVISIAGFVLGQSTVEQQVIDEVRQVVGDGAGDFVANIVEAQQQGGAGTVATIIGLATLIFAATNVFFQLQLSLNQIWGIEMDPDEGMMNMLKGRALSLGLVAAAGFLLLISLVISTAISALVTYAADITPLFGTLMQVVNFLVSLTVITFVFAMIFKLLPDADVRWSDVGVGALVTALLFLIGQYAISFYLSNSAVASAYGAAGSLVVILLWVFYSVQILLFGAEFTQVYARHYGSRIQGNYELSQSEGQQGRGVSTPATDAPVVEPTALRPDVERQPVTVSAAARPNGGWFAGFLGGLVVAIAGLVGGLLFGGRE